MPKPNRQENKNIQVKKNHIKETAREYSAPDLVKKIKSIIKQNAIDQESKA